MTPLVGALAVGIGIHLAVALFLLLRYLDGRDRVIGWWSTAYTFFAGHVIAETLIAVIPIPAWFALRHVLFIAAAWAVLHSFRPRWWIGVLAAVGSTAAAWLAPVSWIASAGVASLVGGAGFVASAWLLYVQEGGLESPSSALLFWGLLLTGLHAFDYPILRPHPGFSVVGAAFSGIFTLAFGIGIVLRAWERTRELVTVSKIAETLNRSLDVRGALTQALHELTELMHLQSGWIFLRKDEAFQVMATENLPATLAANEMEAMRGDCRCLQLLREGHLTEAVNIVDCLRLEKAGWDRPRHATVPLRSSGSVIGVMNLILPSRRKLTSRELAALSTIGHQIGLAAERAGLYEELREKEAMRGRLLEKVMTAHEDERRRIARELHDEAGQALTALILNLEMAEQSDQPIDQQRLTRLRGIAEDTLGELRRLIYDLRPSILDDLGLAAAVRWYVKEAVEPQGLQVSMNIAGLTERLPHYVETAIFRIVQEALTNILKHAHAHQATVEVSLINNTVRLVIADDGQGFETTSILRSREGGLGLLGMKERAELLGGAWKVTSQPGAGTQVEAMIPVEQSGDQH